MQFEFACWNESNLIVEISKQFCLESFILRVIAGSTAYYKVVNSYTNVCLA